MEDFPYDKYIAGAWTTAKAPKAKTTTLAKGALKAKSKVGEESPSRETKVTLKDLCPEEKAKIGELVKKLATTKSEKEMIEKQRQDEMQEMQAKLQSLEQHNKKLARSKQKLSSQLEQYMEELSALHREKAVEPAVERPITPVRSVKEEGTQAEGPKVAEDKEIQATEPKAEEQPRPQKAIHEVQSLKREIATLSTSLRNFTSSSMSSPYLSSQMQRSRISGVTESERPSEVQKPSFKQLFKVENPEEEERFRSVLERAAASSQRAKRFMCDSGSISDAKETPEKPETDQVQVQTVPYDQKYSQLPVSVASGSRPELLVLRGDPPFTQPSSRPDVQFLASGPRADAPLTSSVLRSESPFAKRDSIPPFAPPRPEVPVKKTVAQFTSSIPSSYTTPKPSDQFDPPLCEADLSIMDQVYNESLFDLVEEMERSSKPTSVVKRPGKGLAETIEELELGTELEYSAGSSPWREKDDEDSFEELQRRNQKLKSTVGDVVGRKKETWRP